MPWPLITGVFEQLVGQVGLQHQVQAEATVIGASDAVCYAADRGLTRLFA